MKSILQFLIIGFIIYTAITFEDNVTKYHKMEKYVGKEVIIDKDTLKVVDLSFFRNTYTLSNGLVVNKNLVENN